MSISNLNLPGYRQIEQLYSDSKIVVYRVQPTAMMTSVAQTVIVKVLSSEYPAYQDLLNFRHQYAISKNLDLPGVVRTYSLETYHRGYALIMEDFGGISLTEYRQNQPLSCPDVLDIAIGLADTLHGLGQQRIVHKDIKPANILINPTTKQVKLIDFSIASLLPRETQSMLSPSLLEGTLAYISPEQTGRMNRGIDYRTDFYALGVTLYELLLGKLPFETEDVTELIYCHLAQQPIPIVDVVSPVENRVNPDLPAILSQIVAKLMAKNAEDRYQSALGLKYDLEQCLTQYQLTGKIDLFNLGSRDLCDRFLIPEQLYGRAAEVQTLLDGFTRVSQGQTELMLVAGFSGIGKTAVVNQVHKPITRQHGYFIKGKYDQFNRNLPLSAFVQAFRDLIGQLLSESDLQLANWQSQILAAVGENGRVLIEAIPELELIIGSQPTITQLSGTAAQNRFNLLFQKFIEIFTTAEHPLVIFLDDLQWADSASLQLMKLLMGGNGYLLLLGAYRDNEVSPIHPLMLMVQELQQAQVIVQTITLAPLGFRDTNQLIADTLHCSTDRSQPLAKLIDVKTQGNPFFTTQFLQALHRDGEIWFNPEGYWECDITRVEALSLTDDVVEFMAVQLQKLPSKTQEILKLAACIGNQFDLNTLAIVSEQSPLNAASDLWQGLEVGLIVPNSHIYKFYQDFQDFQDLEDYVDGVNRMPDKSLLSFSLSNSSYRFLHDRVQQAAYSLICETEKQSTHLQIGQLLLQSTSDEDIETLIFDIVLQMNLGRDLLTTDRDRLQLAELNYRAGLRAKQSIAYIAAADFARIGLSLLTDRSWQEQYQLSLNLSNLAAETAFLNGEFLEAQNKVKIILNVAKVALDKIDAYDILIQVEVAQQHFWQALKIGLSILKELGVNLPSAPTDMDVLLRVVNTKIGLSLTKPSQILDKSMMVDRSALAALRIMNLLIFPAFFVEQRFIALLSCYGVKLCFDKGKSPLAAMLFSTYGMVMCVTNDLSTGSQFGETALKLAEDFSAKAIRAKAQYTVANLILAWKSPLQKSILMNRAAAEVALEVGDLRYVATSRFSEILCMFYAGESLDDILQRCEIYRPEIDRVQEGSIIQLFDVLQQLCQSFSIEPPPDSYLCQDHGRESSWIADWKNTNNLTSLCAIYGYQAHYAYCFSDIKRALKYQDLSRPYWKGLGSEQALICVIFLDSLICLSACKNASRSQHHKMLSRVKSNQKRFAKWSKFSNQNIQNRYDLVEAERYRIAGKFSKSADYYDRSILAAKKAGFQHEEALANELAAKFYLAWGKEKIAATYMQEAYYGYARWGATAKTNDLEQHYPQLLIPIFHAQQPTFNPLSTLSTITNHRLKNSQSIQSIDTFDLAAVIQSAQALSSTLDITQLIRQLVEIILKNSGAETCILALPTSNLTVDTCDGEWQIHAVATVNAGSINVNQTPQSLVNNPEYPANLIYWIKNTQRTVIFDARQRLALDKFSGSIIEDQYLYDHQPQSVFAIPIVKQESTIGVLYLEHRHAPDIFTMDKKTIVSFLCSQAAIAIDNANLYHNAQVAAVNISAKQSYLEALLNNIPHIAWLKDESSRFISVNQAFGDMSGYAPAEIIGKKDLDIWPVELARKYFDDDLLTMQSGQRKIVEEKILTSQKEERWLETIKTPIRDSNGNITGTVGIALDITDRKTAERKLEFTQFAVDNSVDGIALLKPDGSFAYVNKSMCRMLGYSSTELASMHIWDIDDQASPHNWPNHWQQLKTTGGFSVETHHQSKDGNRYPVEISLNYFEFDGEEYNFTRTRDITASKAAELALSQSQARYQKLAENIPGVIYQFQLNPDGKIVFPYISSVCYELFEIEAAAVIADGSILIDTIYPDDLAEFRRIVAESAQNMTPKLWEGRIVLSSGTIKWIKSASRPERQPDGSIVWDGVLLDITEQQTALRERMQAELDLVKSQQKYYNLIQSINGVVWEYDLTIDRFSFVSDRAVALFGYPISDWLSHSDFWQSHIYPDDLAPALKIYDAAIENHQSCESEYRLIAADGRAIWIYDISTIVCDLDGNPISTNGLFIDISDLKQVETELQQANERLELTNSQLQQATRLKDEFLATMSHELRTPLNAILGMSEALQEKVFGSLNPRQIKSISTIEKSGEHLLSLINDILDVSKIAAGKLALNITEVSLVDLCKSSLAFIKQKAFEKQIQLDTHFPANLAKIFVDERRMRQVLINLLNNAVKFTPNGGLVTLSISVKSAAVCHQTADYSLCFDISDTGIGIAKDDIAKLFQPFIQVDSNLNRKYQGTGLGLVLVKQIVELHGGSVSIASEVGKGSCFSIMLPQTDLNSLGGSIALHPSEFTPIDIPANIPTAPLILLAEDNELNIHTFSSYLIAKGYQVIVANNGHEAIAMYQSQQPDLILMDVQMPNLDGIAAIEYIRQQSTQIQPPIIALTALAMPGDCVKCLAAGANKYLSKPLKLRELHQTIQECLDLN